MLIYLRASLGNFLSQCEASGLINKTLEKIIMDEVRYMSKDLVDTLCSTD